MKCLHLSQTKEKWLFNKKDNNLIAISTKFWKLLSKYKFLKMGVALWIYLNNYVKKDKAVPLQARSTRTVPGS